MYYTLSCYINKDIISIVTFLKLLKLLASKKTEITQKTLTYNIFKAHRVR